MALRNAKPVARFGNLFVYSGAFDLPGDAALILYYRGNAKLFTKNPDLEAAENAFREAARLDPSAYFVNLDLGNDYLMREMRQEALQAYRIALENVRDDRVMKGTWRNRSSGFLSKTSKAFRPCAIPLWSDSAGMKGMAFPSGW